MSYLFTFLPWIVYAALAGHGASGQQHGTLAALAVTVLVIAYKLRKGSTFDALIIEGGFLRRLGVAAHSGSPARRESWAAPGSTLGIAKQTTPREIWSHPTPTTSSPRSGP